MGSVYCVLCTVYCVLCTVYCVVLFEAVVAFNPSHTPLLRMLPKLYYTLLLLTSGNLPFTLLYALPSLPYTAFPHARVFVDRTSLNSSGVYEGAIKYLNYYQVRSKE